MAHNAATGYIQAGHLSKASLSWWYSKNQVGSVYQQLDDGARALDVRPKLFNETVYLQHGYIDIPVKLEKLVQDAVRWCRDNPQELVLLLMSQYLYADETSASYGMSAAMKQVFDQYGVNYVHCTALYGLTVGETKMLAKLPSGGYLLAMDGQDYFGTSCAKENYVQDLLVTCYDTRSSISCKVSDDNKELLRDYVMQSTNNEATDYRYQLGPPLSLYWTPFNKIQAFWQVDSHAITSGLAQMSSILEDNRVSNINAAIVDWVYDGDLASISLLEVDNVALHGNALLSVVRNQCGQTDETVCGRSIPKPRMKYFHLNGLQTFVVLVVLYLGASVAFLTVRRPTLLSTCIARIRNAQSPADLIVHFDDSPSSSAQDMP